MKRLFTLLGLFIALCISAQDVDTKLTKGGEIKGLGKQGDTLVASGTVNYVLKLENDVYGILTLAIEADSVSGTSAFTAYLQKSLNGENWSNVDTLTHSGGGDYYEAFDPANGTSTYWRVTIIATAAAQKSDIKIWGRLNEGFVIEE